MHSLLGKKRVLIREKKWNQWKKLKEKITIDRIIVMDIDGHNCWKPMKYHKIKCVLK